MNTTPRPWKVVSKDRPPVGTSHYVTRRWVFLDGDLPVAETREEAITPSGCKADTYRDRILNAVNTHERAKAVLQNVQQTFLLAKYHREPELVKLYSQIQALLTDMEG